MDKAQMASTEHITTVMHTYLFTNGIEKTGAKVREALRGQEQP
jgi:hypothetical protein